MTWYDESGRRCARPPEHLVIGAELQMATGLLDRAKERRDKAGAQKVWREWVPDEKRS